MENLHVWWVKSSINGHVQSQTIKLAEGVQAEIAYVLFRLQILPSPYMFCFFMDDIQISWQHHDINTSMKYSLFVEGYLHQNFCWRKPMSFRFREEHDSIWLVLSCFITFFFGDVCMSKYFTRHLKQAQRDQNPPSSRDATFLQRLHFLMRSYYYFAVNVFHDIPWNSYQHSWCSLIFRILWSWIGY